MAVNELVEIGDIPLLREEGWSRHQKMARSHFVWSGRGGRSQARFTSWATTPSAPLR